MALFNMKDVDIEVPEYYLSQFDAYLLSSFIEYRNSIEPCRVTVFRMIGDELTQRETVVVGREEVFIFPGDPGQSLFKLDIDCVMFEFKDKDRIAVTSESGEEVFATFDVFANETGGYHIKQISGLGHEKAWRHRLAS